MNERKQVSGVGARRALVRSAAAGVALAVGTSIAVASATTTTPAHRSRSTGGTHLVSSARRIVLPSPSEDTAPPTFPSATPISQARQWLDKALSLRSVKLGALSNEVVASKSLQAATRSAMASMIGADATGISQLEGTVPNAATIPALNTISAQMVVNYRVIVLVTPVVQTVLNAGAQSAEVNTLEALEPSIEAAISTDQDAGKSVAPAQAAFRSLTNVLASVASTDAGVMSSVLALRPSTYPASNATISSSESALGAAAPRLISARADLTKIVQLLAAPGLSSQPKVRELELP